MNQQLQADLYTKYNCSLQDNFKEHKITVVADSLFGSRSELLNQQLVLLYY